MSAIDPSRPDIQAFLTRASASLGTPLPLPKDVFHFGHPDRPEISNLLLSKAIAGRKTATTSWPVPDPLYWGVGDLSVILDGAGKPRAVMRTTEMVRCLFRDVKEDFALAEDEGDYESYRRGHVEFYERQAEMEGRGRRFGEGEEVLCERFVVIYHEGIEGEE